MEMRPTEVQSELFGIKNVYTVLTNRSDQLSEMMAIEADIH